MNSPPLFRVRVYMVKETDHTTWNGYILTWLSGKVV